MKMPTAQQPRGFQRVVTTYNKTYNTTHQLQQNRHKKPGAVAGFGWLHWKPVFKPVSVNHHLQQTFFVHIIERVPDSITFVAG